MTEKEAAKELSDELRVITDILEYCKYFEKESDLALAYRIKRQESMKMAIQALEDIQQYREIGTVEECREASEKQKSKKMRLLNEKDVIKAVDKHTNEDNTLNDDISCILEEVPTAYDVEAVSKALKNEMEFVVSEYPVYGKYIEKNRAIEILHSGVIPQKSQEGPDGKRLREREEFFEER